MQPKYTIQHSRFFSLQRIYSETVSSDKFSKNENLSFTETQQKLVNLASHFISKKEILDKGSMEFGWNYNFKKFKYFGVVFVIQDAFNSLSIINCTMESIAKNPNPPHNLFSWDIEHFLERTNLPDTRYLHEFVKDYYNDLDLIKLKVDLNSILNILDCFLQDITHKAKTDKVQQKLGKIFGLLLLQGNLLGEKRQNEVLSKQLEDQVKNYDKNKRKEFSTWQEWIDNLQNDYYENKLLMYPIELRYVRNYETAQSAQLSRTKEDEDNVYISGTRDYKQKYLREKEVFEDLQVAYETQTERLRLEVEKIMEKYEEDYEILDLELSRVQGRIDEKTSELKKHRKMYEFYKTEIEQYLKQQEAEEAERAWKAMIEAGAEEEGTEATKSEKKKGKGKGKGKESKSKKNTEGKKSKKKKV